MIILNKRSSFFENLNLKIKSDKKYHFGAFLILFLLLLLCFWLITKPINLSYSYSALTSKILLNNGIENNIFYNGLNYGLQINDMTINILDVCTGLFELCVFLALIFANLIIKFKYKIYGFFILIFLFLFFNLIRILTMIWLLSNVNIYLVNILHTILFKIGFFLLFILFYYIWMLLSENRDK